ncbi:hypothetical protein KDM41_04760 [bacterium]|nr:hypothetical protein [bacterium]
MNPILVGNPYSAADGRSRRRRSGILFLVGALLLAGALFAAALPATAQIISFDPAESLPTDPDFTVTLLIDTAGQAVKGVEVKAAYDPFLVQLNAITPGSWYTGSGHLFAFFDYTGVDPVGELHLASAVLDGALATDGVLAVCHFTILGFGISPLVFQDVDVRDPANQDLGFGHSTGDRIILDPVIGVEAASFGAVKALYR